MGCARLIAVSPGAIHRPDELAGHPAGKDLWWGAFGWFRSAERVIPRPAAVFRSAAFWYSHAHR